MSASLVYKLVPVGSLIAWSDGTPRPPERHRKKLATWKTNNSSGRLIRKQASRTSGNSTTPACFTLHEGDLGQDGVIVVRIHRTFTVGPCSLMFTVVERPPVGSVRVFDHTGEGAELVHLAPDRQAAEVWLRLHGYPNAVIEEVTCTQESASERPVAA